MNYKSRITRLERSVRTYCGVAPHVLPPTSAKYAAQRNAKAKELRADRAAGKEIITIRVVPPNSYDTS